MRGAGRAVAAAALLAAAVGTGAGFPGGLPDGGAAPLRPVTFMLDWFPNPDHVPLYAALGEGYFTQAGLRVVLEVPAGTDDPLKLAAVGKVDVAVNYEPNVIIARAQGLPVRSIGLLIDRPLTTVMFLKSSGIRTPKDLVGRQVGFAVTGFADAMLDQVMRSDGASESNVKMVNVGFDLVPALLAHKVAAVVGAYRNYERIQLELQGQAVGMFEPEKYGVPTFYELVLITNDAAAGRRAEVLRRFVEAVDRGVTFTLAHPQEAFRLYVREAHDPKLNDALNQRSFQASLPYYARNQHQSAEQWRGFSRWLAARKVIKTPVPADQLYTNLVP
jgi:putative hydroxymethylpyrimidine transport system substrate-binding protein